MDPIIFLSILFGIYCVMSFFDMFFKSCMHYPYHSFLHKTGLTVQFLRIKWHTTAFNRTMFRWGSSSKLLSFSFNIGVFFALALIPISVIILIMTLFKWDLGSGKVPSSSTTSSSTQAIPQMQILLPGVTLPLQEIGFYVATLIICSILHEMGHALAAVLEDVPVSGFGIMIYFCFPFAFTRISPDHMNSLRLFRKLKVLCGGIWHNILLAVFCYLIYSTLGFIAKPFYQVNESLIITSINKNSPLLGEKGLFEKDIITHINDCKTYDMDSWYDCLIKSIRSRPGYCVSSNFIHINDESSRVYHGPDGVIQCCADPKNEKTCCFEYIEDLSNDDPIEIPQHLCLDIRKTIEDSSTFCSSQCDRGFCIRPLLKNTTAIITIKRENNPKDVIFVGHPVDISRSIEVSQFVPKVNIFTPGFADTISLFLKYNIVFSLGLAVVNAIPCFGLDGYQISSTIINSMLINKVTERNKRDLITILVTSLGSFLLFSWTLKVLWKSILEKFI
ncbi:membrane-bound transcription factor site-2 protease [Condylostylus longicornis]|uniref:membrane-bound transcription factor site-2 protease n=1 Tax=Condylostylus longicornis TaxID=2530218 RepID=UPI00244E0033|nr:membrane-bound transcription factor site-2 protease [Condylostylus longicornis]